jgi:hypothetical protein
VPRDGAGDVTGIVTNEIRQLNDFGHLRRGTRAAKASDTLGALAGRLFSENLTLRALFVAFRASRRAF